MSKDIDLMTKNAKTYNEPGSQVFKVTPYSSFCFFILFVYIFVKVVSNLNSLVTPYPLCCYIDRISRETNKGILQSCFLYNITFQIPRLNS